MIVKREYNPHTGMEITYEVDPMNPRLLHVHQKQRQDETIALATRVRNEGGVHLDHGRIAGFITPGLALQWGKAHGVNPFQLPGGERMECWKRILNDSDYSNYRVTEGRI